MGQQQQDVGIMAAGCLGGGGASDPDNVESNDYVRPIARDVFD